MASKHIDINYRDNDGRWHYEKVWFTQESFRSASGKEYRLGHYVNKGSDGTLFHCQAPDGSPLAVKLLHQLDEQRLSRFEFEVLADLSNPNVLTCIDGGDIQTTHKVDVAFLVTKLFHGNLEYQVATKKYLSPAEAKKHDLSLLDALEYIHNKGVIHRDIKPSNLLLSTEHGALLGDFGIAKTSTDEGATRYYRHDVTMLGNMMGPMFWLSPELAAHSRNKEHLVDHRSDLFQAGIVIWYLLTGEIPRGGLDEAEARADLYAMQI